jgi:hypothetical protein
MGFYGEQVLPRLTDRMLGGAPHRGEAPLGVASSVVRSRVGRRAPRLARRAFRRCLVDDDALHDPRRAGACNLNCEIASLLTNVGFPLARRRAAVYSLVPEG